MRHPVPSGRYGDRRAARTAGTSANLPGVRDVEIREDTIRLGQLLKLAGVVGSGGEARALLESGAVTVNGDLETRRGRQLHRGDQVIVDGETLRVA